MIRQKGVACVSIKLEANPIETTFTAKLGSSQSDVAPGGAIPTSHGAVDDGALARRLAEGDESVLAEIYDRYAASLYRTLQALLCSSADAEDALQEVFVKVAMGRTSRIRDLRSYLFVAARHEAFNILRRRKRETPMDDSNFSAPGIEKTVSANDQTPTYDWAALLARLPVEQREVVALKVWEEMTFAEIAQIIRISPNTVMSRYRYGIQRLRSWCREEDAHEHPTPKHS